MDVAIYKALAVGNAGVGKVKQDIIKDRGKHASRHSWRVAQFFFILGESSMPS